MTDANVRDETTMRELNDLFISDIDETRQEQESFSRHEEAATDDIPPSLISYFETSRSRAAVCEKLVLEEPREGIGYDFTTIYEDIMNLPVELSGEMVKLSEQVFSEAGNENNTCTDSCLLHDPAEVTHNVEVCPNSKEDSEYKREHTEKQQFEEMKKEEQIRRRECNFQEELKKLMEAEKLHQLELQLMEKRAQEKLEQEFLLQQELLSNLQKQVEEERRIMEEEIKRMKEEEKKRRGEEEKKRKEEEEEKKRKEEEEEKKRKEEEEEKKRKEEEEEKKRKEEEEEIKREKDRKKKEEEKMRNMQIQRMEEEMRKVKEEEENRKIKEMKAEEQKKKEEEERRREEEKNKMEKELWKKEEERKNKERKDKIKEKETNMEREQEEETMRKEEVIKVTVRKIEGDKKRTYEKEIIYNNDWQNEEGKTRVVENITKEEEVRITKEQEEKKGEITGGGERRKAEITREEERRKAEITREEERRKAEITREEERRKAEITREEERRKAEINNMMDEQVKKEQEEHGQMQLSQNKEKTKKDMERRCSIENKCMMKEEEEIRQKDEKDIIQINTDIQKSGEMEEVIMIKEKERSETNEGDERQLKEELGGNRAGTIKTEERRLREEDKYKMIIVQVPEKEARLKRANENNSRNTQSETKSTGSTGHSLTSQREDNSTWTSLGPGPSHSSFETEQQGDRDRNIHKANDQQDPAVQLHVSPSSSHLYLPEHTERKRLSWMKDCVPWSKLSLQNRRKPKASVRTQRFQRRAAEASSLPPLCADTLLQSAGCKSLQEVITVTLEDLPGCILSSLVQCTQLRSLTLRRCGLKSLEGISQLSELCYIDVEENEISFVNCENMTSLQVLRLGHNKLTSIHGLSGTDNLDVLELSHNNITRIAGLESMRRLQRLSVDHNQLISTKGLRDVYTLLHLNCSHNHLPTVEGLENSALLHTLDLTANSLTEPPSLNNHVLLRELRLDDNSISSLQGLSSCWLPLLQHLSVAQNRITQLPSMSDFVSLAYLDLRFNCMSELQNVCESLDGCQFLQKILLTANPLQHESGWRSALQKALPGLKAIDDQDTDSFLSPPAVQQISFASVSFQTFCQAQFQQINDLQQQHSRELSKASSSLDAMKSFCQHFTETLKLAEEQRFAHEYGDKTVSACQTVQEKTATTESTNAQTFTPADIPSRNDIRRSYRTVEEKPSAGGQLHTSDTVTAIPQTGLLSLTTTTEKTSSSNIKTAAHRDLDLKNSTAAVVIQQQWRKYKQKCADVKGPPAAKRGGRSGGKAESRPLLINRSDVNRRYAATIIQAFWRGCSVRRRLASALAAVTCSSSGEDDTFEEVDVDEFVFDEAALEKHWTLELSKDSSSRHEPMSEQPISLKLPGSFPDAFKYTLPPPPVWRPKQAWVAGEEVASAGQRLSPESSHRKSPESTSVISGISERSEKILEEWGFTDSHTALQMLKRAQKMKSKQQLRTKRGDASFRNCHYQLGPVQTRNRPSPHSGNHKKVCKAELGLQQAERTEHAKQEGAQPWLRTQSDRSSESEHFLPKISSDILNGGRVQLVCVQADPTCTERHHASGLWTNNSSPHRISSGHARKDVAAPKRVSSAPSKKERISFRDNPVQLSGGWGGGKKREK